MFIHNFKLCVFSIWLSFNSSETEEAWSRSSGKGKGPKTTLKSNFFFFSLADVIITGKGDATMNGRVDK